MREGQGTLAAAWRGLACRWVGCLGGGKWPKGPPLGQRTELRTCNGGTRTGQDSPTRTRHASRNPCGSTQTYVRRSAVCRGPGIAVFTHGALVEVHF